MSAKLQVRLDYEEKHLESDPALSSLKATFPATTSRSHLSPLNSNWTELPVSSPGNNIGQPFNLKKNRHSLQFHSLLL